MGYFPPTLVLFAFGVYLMAAMLFHLNFQPLIRRYPNPKANTGVSETTCPLLSSQRDHLIRFRNHTFPISQPEDFRMDGTVGVYITSSFVSLSSGVPVVSFAVFRASTWSEATSICTGCSGELTLPNWPSSYGINGFLFSGTIHNRKNYSQD